MLMTLQPILVTLSQNDQGKIEYNAISSTLLSEMLKIVISTSFYFTTKDNTPAQVKPLEVLEFSVPALVYFVNNNLVFLILNNVDATTFQLLSQLKTIFTGLLFRIFLKRELTAYQYLAIWMLACGTGTSQLPSCLAVGATSESRSSFVGMSASVVSCSLSAFAGIYNEKLMKGKPKDSIHWQNIQLYSWGILFNFLGIVVNNSEALLKLDFFSGYNRWACAVVVNNALNGLAISAILKHADNIARVYAHAVAMLVTMVLSVLFFGLTPTPQMMIGIAVVGASAVQYNYKPAADAGTHKYAPVVESEMIKVQTPAQTVGKANDGL